MSKAPFKALVPVLALPALALGGCAAEEEDTSYEVGVEDVGGGELQVADPQPGEVPVELPETPMINVPTEEAGDEDAEAAEPAE